MGGGVVAAGAEAGDGAVVVAAPLVAAASLGVSGGGRGEEDLVDGLSIASGISDNGSIGDEVGGPWV